MESYIREVRIVKDRVDEDSYLNGIRCLMNLDTLDLSKPVTIFEGENGTGKSTLLGAIAETAGFNPEGGSKFYSFSTYDQKSELANAIKLVRGISREKWGYYLRAESFFNVASMEEEYAKGYTQSLELHRMSHGQSFMKIIEENMNSGLFILDEPEAALSASKQLEFISRVHDAVINGSQFIIATHSPIILGYPDAVIYSFDADRIEEITYEQTPSYMIMKEFINNRKRMTDILTSDVM